MKCRKCQRERDGQVVTCTRVCGDAAVDLAQRRQQPRYTVPSPGSRWSGALLPCGYVKELTDECGDRHGEAATDDHPQCGTGDAGAGDPRTEDPGDGQAD